jgi:hypothetical protein
MNCIALFLSAIADTFLTRIIRGLAAVFLLVGD